MRILTIGGGPAGLYASLLLKKAHPDLDITLVEQNRADATYGWGVVFSDRTLSEFREADYPTFVSITDAFVLWDAIDIRYRHRLIRAGGQPFAGVARKTLLSILHARCRDLGVELRFEEPASDDDAPGGYDLVLAADGVHSPRREARREVFGTRLAEGRARYIWFGTPLPLESFTFVFRESEHGLFQSHAYPFDGTTSTWIVECHEDVWRRAGLDEATTDESIAFCRELFAEELRGRPLLSNNSKWIGFVTVKNRRWRDGNVVLLGDAAHTAHFSIGSGTKLAMEDAIALARGFERHPADPDAALADYEAERRPRVERFQEAARSSQEYFENVSRYLRMEPEQFAFYLLTRSGRIDYTGLRMRDPMLVAEVDRTLAGEDRLAALPPLHLPLKLRGRTLTSRVAVSLPARYDGADGSFDTAGAAEAARRGAALVLPQVVAVAAEGRITPGDPGLYSPEHAETWRAAADGVHQHGRMLGLRLGHAGPRAGTRPRTEGTDRPLPGDDWPRSAASALAYSPAGPVPKPLSEAEMDRLVDRFEASARWAAEAGVDLLLVHAAHGYLLASFVSPLTNLRGDTFGGALGNRLRFPLRVFDAVRKAWPDDRPLGATITADDWARSGAGPDEAVEVARALAQRGCDLIEPVAGQTVWSTRPTYGPAYLAPYADRLRNEIGVPVLLSGAIATPDAVNTLIAGGRADLCVLDA